MSAAGQGAVIAVLLLIAAAIFGLLPLVTIFLSVPLLACAGVYDSYRHHRQMRQQRGKAAEPAPRKPDSPGR
jgi:fatty acid desaturase